MNNSKATTPDLERPGRAILREASLLNNPQIQDNVHQRTATTMIYARRYAAAVILCDRFRTSRSVTRC